jgi:raffinose/stachyose/melibiose transport system permease protein
VLISVALLIFLGSVAAYALARRQTQLSYGLYLLFLLGIILLFRLALIPL